MEQVSEEEILKDGLQQWNNARLRMTGKWPTAVVQVLKQLEGGEVSYILSVGGATTVLTKDQMAEILALMEMEL